MLLKFENITKVYGSSDVKALNNFSTEIRSGEIVGLIGKNGSGKTTLMNCLTNNIHITSGEIFYNNKNLMNNKDLIAQFGVLIESSFLDYLNAYENLKLLMLAEGATDKKQIHHDIDRVLTLVGLEKRKNDYVKHYSFGMKQRLGLAQALLRDKQLLILDEPLVGLDVIGQNLVKNLIKDLAKKEGKAIIFSDHNLNEVKDICDRIIYLENGEKLFDDVFDDRKTYLITIEGELQSNTLESCRQDNGRIVVNDSADLDETINKIIVQNCKIVDIEVHQQSLMQFFKGD